MKKILFISFATATATVLIGCSTSKQYTTDYLFEHDDIRKQVLADCKANKESDSNCTNAAAAEAKKFNSTGGKKVQKW